MSTRTLLTIAIISVTAFTGCKSVYSTVYSNKKNSFKPPVVPAKIEIKASEMVDALSTPPSSGLPPAMSNDQNAIPGLTPMAPDAATPAAPAAGAIPGLQ